MTTLHPLAIVAQLRTESLSMRRPEGDVAAELADQLAAAITALPNRPAEPYAASLLALVTAIAPLEAKGWLSANRYIDARTAELVAEARFAMAVARRHLGMTA
jgi:hypothetical protein